MKEHDLILSILLHLICHPFSNTILMYYLLVSILIWFQKSERQKITVVVFVRYENFPSWNSQKSQLSVAELTRKQFNFHQWKIYEFLIEMIMRKCSVFPIIWL